MSRARLQYHHFLLWLAALFIVDSILFPHVGGDELSNFTAIEDTRTPMVEASSYLEILKNSGTASWAEVETISRVLAKDLASSPTSLSHMNALISFLSAVPENVRLHMTETAVAVLLGDGLEDSASCLMGNMALTSPEESELTEVFYRRSLEIDPRNQITVRSFGFKLQSQGRIEDALRLYDDHLRLDSNQPALRLIRASVCPHCFMSIDDSLIWYKTLLKRLAESLELLRGLDNPLVEDLHLSLQQQPSIGWQYLGLPIAPLVELMNENLLVMDPGLTKPAPGLSPTKCWGVRRSSSEIPLDKGQRNARGSDNITGTRSSPERRIRVGIIMERRGNASPERVFAVVVHKLDRLKFEIVVFAQDAPQAPPGATILAVADRVILLPRHEGMASVAESTHAGGGKVVSPGLPNLHRSREIIQAEQLDCVFYLALGASLFQHLLSIGRLAPLQLSFGLGHPITSGHYGIDFFVSSDLFEMPQEANERGDRSEDATRERCSQTVEMRDGTWICLSSSTDAAKSGGSLTKISSKTESYEVTGYNFDRLSDTTEMSRIRPRVSLSRRSLMYSEQVVLFDSFTGIFEPPRSPDPASVRSIRDRIVSLAIGREHPESSIATDPQTAVMRPTEELSNGDHDTSADAKKASRPRNLEQNVPEGHMNGEGKVWDEGGESRFSSQDIPDNDIVGVVHLYHCIQDAKKFLPSFDVAMRGVLDADPEARLLLPSTAKVHSERWNHSLGPERTERLLFVSEMEHPVMMKVMAACDVMLAPWGWGAGITSFEALAVGLPVVTLPTEESVLHFSMGQVSLLGLENDLVAEDFQDYVSKAVRLANDPPHRDAVSKRILKSRELLFGEVAAASVAQEWGEFIERGVRMVCP